MTKQEAYAILGISSQADAKLAMRKLVQIHHPDKGGTTTRFSEIMDAYRLVANSTYRIERLSFGKVADVRESVFSRRFVKCLQGHGALVYVMTGSSYMVTGMPDLYFCHPWLQGWVELKVENKKVADAQARQLVRLNKLGSFGCVVRNRVNHGIIFEINGSPCHLLKKLEPKSLLQALIQVSRLSCGGE